jgi:hypothetical protein
MRLLAVTRPRVVMQLPRAMQLRVAMRLLAVTRPRVVMQLPRAMQLRVAMRPLAVTRLRVAMQLRKPVSNNQPIFNDKAAAGAIRRLFFLARICQCDTRGRFIGADIEGGRCVLLGGAGVYRDAGVVFPGFG